MSEKIKHTVDDIKLFKRLAEIRREGLLYSPDAFNLVARELFGMSIKEAQNLHSTYVQAVNGTLIWRDGNEEEIVDTLMKAQQVIEHSQKMEPADTWRSIDSYIGDDRYDRRNAIGVWARYGCGKPQLFEYMITNPKHLSLIADMERSESVEIICIVPCVDYISNPGNEGCINDLSGMNVMNIYDGDIFVAMNKGSDSYWNRENENGVYVCINGAYRRLLYTVGRGYLTIDKEPNIADDSDEDDEYGNVFSYAKGRWNSHILTMDHKWMRIGNIHADVTLLMEKKEG